MSLKSSPDSPSTAQDLPAGLTPELMQWVREQRASGIGPAALLRSMRDVGWSEELARRALDLPTKAKRRHRPSSSRPPRCRSRTSPRTPPASMSATARSGTGQHAQPAHRGLRQPARMRSATPSSPPRVRAWRARSPWPRKAAVKRSMTTAPATACSSSAGNRHRPPVGRTHRPPAALAAGPRRRPAGAALRPGRRVQAPPRLLRARRTRHAHHPQARRPARGHAGHLPERARARRRHHLPRSAASSGSAPGNAVFFSYERPDPSTRTLHGGAPVLAGENGSPPNGCASANSTEEPANPGVPTLIDLIWPPMPAGMEIQLASKPGSTRSARTVQA